MSQSASIGKLAEALAATQNEMKAPKKDRTGKVKGTTKDGKFYEYEYHYADLAGVIESRRVGAKHGLSITQGTEMRDGYLALTTMLMHTSGEWKEWECPIPAGLKPQELGSYLTYMRRYSECGAWGIAAEEDDDGAKANDAPGAQTPQQQRRAESKPTNGNGLPREDQESIHAAAKKAGIKSVEDLGSFLFNGFGVRKASELPKGELKNVLEALAQMAEHVSA